MSVRVDLIVPGLFHLPAAQLDAAFLSRELPALHGLLRYARPQKSIFRTFETMIADSLGMDPALNLPVANAYRRDDHSGQLLLCRAVHLQPDQHRALLVPLDRETETTADSRQIMHDLAVFFRQDCDLTDLGDGLWLMHLAHCRAPSHYPHYLSVARRRVDPYVEQLPALLPWHQLFNEMQMFMHLHGRNENRLHVGKPSINSLWCWGAGAWVQATSTPRWYCDDPILNGYAERLGASRQPPETLSASTFRESALCIDLSLLEGLESVATIDFQQRLLQLETTFIAPLMQAARMGRITLVLRTGYENEWVFSRFSACKIWRKSQNLIDWMQ